MADQQDTYSDIEDDDYTTQTFNKASEHVKKLIPQIPPQKLLQIYALYKQATTGACTIPRPRFFEINARAKWDAWHALKAMPEECAKKQYIQIITELDPSFADEKTDNNWVTVSCLQNTDETINDTDKTVFDYCKENNLAQLEEALNSDIKLSLLRDENGLGLIHWAADRGNLEILKFLVLAKNLDVNMVDDEGQTALHYAASCDYFVCVEFLVKTGADCHLTDNDGLKPVDLATDSNILKLLKEFM